jgi:predicted metallopeptidase
MGMGIKYYPARDIQKRVEYIAEKLKFKHIDPNRVICVRSAGSSARNVIARCHALGKIWQMSLNTRAHYLIEVISEQYEKLPQAEKDKILIHELMHIPHSFGGGFRNHKPFVTQRKVDAMYRQFVKSEKNSWFF